MLRDRGPAAGAPLRRAVALEEPALLVHVLEEAPDVLDVRVAEGVVVVPPVHPLAQPDRAARQLACEVDDLLAALLGELREPVRLDVALGVEAELALHADFDPETLAVEAILVALVEPAERLVALEDVLQRPAPRGVDGELLVRGHRAVDEAEPWTVLVLAPQAIEDALALPPVEHLELERGVIRDGIERREGAGHLRLILGSAPCVPGRTPDTTTWSPCSGS